MTLWIAWSLLTSALLTGAAAALERAASFVGGPRRFVWIAAMLAAATAPVVLAARRPSVDELPPRSTRAVSPPVAIPAGTFFAQRRSRTTMSVLKTPSGGLSQPAGSADRWLVAAWVLASLAMALVFARELIRLRRRRSEWSSVDTEIGAVLVSRDVGPAVVGFFHPRIVVPSWTLSAERTTRDLLLRHELEHIRAGDTRLLFAAELALILAPWNAALWWMTRRLRLAIELDCDARVVQAIGGAHAYGLVLLGVGERYAAGVPLATPFSGSRLNLEVRIDAMTAPRKRYPVFAALPFAAITVGVLVTAAWMPRPTSLVRARAATIAAAAPARSTTGDVHSPVTPAPVRPVSPYLAADSVQFAPAVAVTPPYWSPSVSQRLAYQVQEPRVTVDFDNSPIETVLDVFAKYSHRRIVPAKNVSGTITGVVRDQPWRYALRALLNANGYDFTVEADSSLLVDVVAPVHEHTAHDTTLAGVGYVARKQAGDGFYIDGSQIDRQARAFSEIVRLVPGFRVAPSPDSHAFVITDAQRGADGCVNFFVDGLLWQTITPGDIDTAVRPAQVVAIEAYRSSSTPSQFVPRDQNRCATIVVWTGARVRPD